MSEDTALAVPQQEVSEMLPSIAQTANLLQNTKMLNLISKLADKYANSTMIPDAYRNNPNNCFVALEIASRMNVSPLLVMQNLYIVKGKPSWTGQACKALIDGCGKFRNSEYVMTGSLKDGTLGCYLQAINVKTGQVVKGTEVTLKMARDEGWIDKPGSKWKTMPEQMLKYRAAAFFARTECPEVLMGFQTTDEIEDVYGPTAKSDKEKVVISIEPDNN